MSNVDEHGFTKDIPVHKIKFEDFGMGYFHDMPCAVYHGDEEDSHAVLNTNKGVFEPSWKAQKEGWHLVHAQTKFQKFLIRKFFNKFN
jgi:hypothetical protein